MTAILLISLMISVLYYFSYPEVDPDLWGHVFFGKEIINGVGLPLQNLYSYTSPNHFWINHEWLAEVLFFGLYRLFGSPGLILFKVILGGSLVWILDQVIKTRAPSPVARVITLVWAMAILSPGFNIRPQIFTYLLFTVFLFLFYRYEETRRAHLLYWIPFLMALWVNLHGGFVVGLGALALFSTWALIKELRKEGQTEVSLTHLAVPLLLSAIFLHLNPYGFSLLSFLAGDLLLKRAITEWEPIPLLGFSFVAFKIAALVALVFSLRRNAVLRWDFILVVLAVIFALLHQRHTPLFAIAAAPFLAQGVQWGLEWLKNRVRERVFAACVFGIALYQLYGIGQMHWNHKFQLIVKPLEYPTQAADFLERNGFRGNMAVPFDWGEYLIWKLYPEVRVSIDGRYTTAYPKEVIDDHWEWMAGRNGWRRLLERYPTEIAITKRRHPVTQLLRNDPEWIYIYSDPVSFVFVRKTPSQEPFLTKFREKRLLPPRPSPIYFPG